MKREDQEFFAVMQKLQDNNITLPTASVARLLFNAGLQTARRKQRKRK